MMVLTASFMCYAIQLHDLHIGQVGEHRNTKDECPQEDEICGLVSDAVQKIGKCGSNGMCIGNLVNQKPRCICRPGWRGNRCNFGIYIHISD